MRQKHYGANLTQLTRFASWFPINCYLVREDDGLTLIDAAIGGSAEAILDAARARGLPIRRIVLTHLHMDHVGALDALHAALPAAEVVVSERAARLLTGDTSSDPAEPPLNGRDGTQRFRTRPTRLVRDGDQIGSLRVVNSSGHAPGHIALFDERDSSLIAGDAFQTQGGLAVAGKLVWSFPFPTLACWHRPTALDSARRLRALNPARLAVGHGEVLEQPLAAIDEAIAAAERSFGIRQPYGA